jgi:hypothetical protein
MYNFCTLFDSNYLSRGLAMFESLKSYCDHFHLYVFAFDDKTAEILNKMAHPQITVVTLKAFENEKLLAVKPLRSRAEYCWTCTSSTILYVLNNFDVDNCTYLDADLYFYNSPKLLFDEMGDKSVLITEHRYTKKYDRTDIAGKYCVQFLTFKKNEEGLKVLNWWVDACLEWCYDRYEDGKFGDQKYLDNWTDTFKGVHVLEHLGGGMAPWNVQQYQLMQGSKSIKFKEIATNKVFDLVFYHYHYVRFYKNDLVDLGWFSLPKKTVKKLYVDYIRHLNAVAGKIKQIDSTYTESLRPFNIKQADGIKDKAKILIKLLSRINLYKKSKFIA